MDGPVVCESVTKAYQREQSHLFGDDGPTVTALEDVSLSLPSMGLIDVSP